MSLEACNFEGALLLRCCGAVNPEVLPLSLSKVSSSSTVIAPFARRKLFLRRFPSKLDENTQFVAFNGSSDVESLLREVSAAAGPVCILDSMDLLIQTLGVDSVCKLISRIKDSRLVVVSCHEKTVTPSDWNRLLSVADQYFTVGSRGNSEIVAEGVLFKKNGKIASVTETVEILPEIRLKSRKYEDRLPEVEMDEPAPSASFNMGLMLKESERAAKEQLQLPYMSTSNTEGLVNLRNSDKKVRVGGQIIYEPDEADDLDDSDPDDDLNL